jgi:hypothetical protein
MKAPQPKRTMQADAETEKPPARQYVEYEERRFDPMGKGLDYGVFFGLLLGAAATALKQDVLYFAAPLLTSMALGLLWGYLTKRKYSA